MDKKSSIERPFEVGFFKPDPNPPGHLPVLDLIERWPVGVQARLFATLDAVASAPPYRFAGGGYFEAMHGEMQGWFEVRARSGTIHYRLFCLLDRKQVNFEVGLLAVITGASKANGRVFTDLEYRKVRDLGTVYDSKNPRQLSPLVA